MKPDPVQLINETDEPFRICGLARELWPVLIDRLDELEELPRMAVEHYAAESSAAQ
jgi:hypothetical protein